MGNDVIADFTGMHRHEPHGSCLLTMHVLEAAPALPLQAASQVSFQRAGMTLFVFTLRLLVEFFRQRFGNDITDAVY